MLEFKTLWDQAYTFPAYMDSSQAEHKGLWEGIHRLARIPEWARAAVPADAKVKLLVLAEDWCGDAANTVPMLAKWAEETPGLELRILKRDEHPEVMDRYLTGTSRSIPIVIVLDRDFRELGHWGPRPLDLQAWVMENKPKLQKEELYQQVRKWYARDRGESTLREVLAAAGLPELTGLRA